MRKESRLSTETMPIQRPTKIRHTRPITLADSMILLAAVAGGLTMARAYSLSVFENMRHAEAIRSLILLQALPTAIVSPLMVVLVPFGLLQPRPSRQRLARQPGYVACCAGTVGVALAVAEQVLFRNTSAVNVFTDARTFLFFWASCTGAVEPIVIGAWLLLALSGRWRPEATWVDRLGRVIGAIWIFSLLLIVFSDLLLRFLPAI
jgi:hypothetical protein